MTSVLLTGASGFLGKQVMASLLLRDYEVHAITRNQVPCADSTGVSWHSIDLLDCDAVRDMIESVRPKNLIHLAWDATPGLYWNSPANLEWLAASCLLLKHFSRLGGERVVIAGSCAEYQWDDSDGLDELSTPIVPDSLYGVSKNALREVVSKWAPGVGISWAWGRFFNVFGPNEKPVRLLPKVIRTLLDGKPLPFDSGMIIRDFMHVADASDALIALFQSEVQGPVNLASGDAVSVRDVIAIVAAYLHTSELVNFGTRAEQSDQPHRVVADIRRLRNEVGWHTNVDIRERLHQTCDWWRLIADGNS